MCEKAVLLVEGLKAGELPTNQIKLVKINMQLITFKLHDSTLMIVSSQIRY